MKKKILHVVSCLNIDSGVMNFIMNYYRNINRNEYQFDFLYFIKGEKTYENEIINLGGKCFFLNKPSIKSYNEYQKFFKQNKGLYNAIHLHELYLNFIILPLAKKSNIKILISHAHATKFSDKKISAVRNKLLCLPLKKTANTYLACSKLAANTFYGKKSVKKNKVEIINNSINVDLFKFNINNRNKIRSELKIEGKFVVGNVGRFSEQKNHLFLIDIFNEIKNKQSNSILILIGEGHLLEVIKNKVKILGLEEDVIFLGRKNNVYDYFQAMDTFILPSLFEGLPVVGIEAQASGLPCFFSDAITKEVEVVNSEFISLKNSASKWADIILDYNKKFVRINTEDYINKKGFNIKTETNKLIKYYDLS